MGATSPLLRPVPINNDVLTMGRVSPPYGQWFRDLRTNLNAATVVVVGVQAFGATGDGVTDDAPAIQAAIEACADAGGGHVSVPAGRYLCGQGLILRDGVTLVGAGAHQATLVVSDAIVATAGAYYLISATSLTQIGIVDLGLDGNQAALVAAGYPTTVSDRIYDLVHVTGCSTVRLQRIAAANCLGGATILCHASSDDVWITDSEIRDAGTNGLSVTCDGIYMNATSHVRVMNTQITDWTDTGLVWEHAMEDCLAFGNCITSTVGGQDCVFIGGNLDAADHWVINNNLSGRRGVYVTRLSGSASRLTIAQNHITACSDTFIYIQPTGAAAFQDLTITDNALDGANSAGTNFNGIALDGAAGTIGDVYVAGNRIRNIQKSGVRLLGDLSQVQVSRNALIDCGVGGTTTDQQSGIAVLATGTQTDLQIESNQIVCNGATMPYGVYYELGTTLVQNTVRNNHIVGATVALIGDPTGHVATDLYQNGNGWPY